MKQLLPTLAALAMFLVPLVPAKAAATGAGSTTVAAAPVAPAERPAAAPPGPSAQPEPGPSRVDEIQDWLDKKFGQLVAWGSVIPFYNLAPWLGFSTAPQLDPDTGQPLVGANGKPVVMNIPFVVLWLIIAAVLLTLYMRFVNVRLFGHAVQVVAGRYDNPEDAGEVTHFQALSSALSATVGLGNIAGVAIAVSIGGPGATLWMIVAGLLGMTLKFTECTLGQRYRKIDEHGRVSGGPMHYLRDGLAKRGLGPLGSVLALVFTVFCIGGSLAGGNSFQVNQSLGILAERVPFFADHRWIYGLIMAFFVGIVIIGGIRRIAQTAEKIVPAMCGIYVVASITIILFNVEHVPAAVGAIFGGAFEGHAIYGGVIGSLIMGFQRAAFSNEAGIGSASIAHSAARTEFPVREGIVALLEPFIDTVVVCTMTALVVIISGVYNAPVHHDLIVGNRGAALTSEAFQTVPFLASWFPWVLMVAVVLFAFSTMISWSYYGERCWTKLFGQGSSLSYKILFLVFVLLGSVITASNILDFGDLMILLMAFPNIFGLYILCGEVKGELTEYETKLAAGDLRVYEPSRRGKP